MKQLSTGRITEEELERTKNQLIGNTLLGLESSNSWMSHIARNEIYFGRAISPEDIAAGVRAVTREDIVELAGEILRPEGIALTLLGDFDKNPLDLRI